jgi:tetratricopeptide (TPR) repeat protein
MDIRAAWGTYKPASLPMSDWRAPMVGRANLEDRFKDELPTLRKIRLQNLGQRYLKRLQTDPKDGTALLQLGSLYARAGEPQEAVGILEKACALLADQAVAHNNLGNTYFLLEDYAQAEVSYRRAAELEPDDAEILVNLARVQMRLKKDKEAAVSFQAAMTLRPEIAEKYRSLTITLGSTY